MKKAEIKNVKSLLHQHNVVCSTSLHDFILNQILSFSVKLKEVKEDEFHKRYEDCLVDMLVKSI